MTLDLDDLFDKAEKLMAQSREWQETFTAPVVRQLITEATEARTLRCRLRGIGQNLRSLGDSCLDLEDGVRLIGPG